MRINTNPRIRIEEIDSELAKLPKGTLTYKNINGKQQPYIQRTIDGKSVSYYVKSSEREEVLLEFEKRARLIEEKKYLQTYYEGIKSILKNNPYLEKKLGIGYMYYDEYYKYDLFYVDKTQFISQWIQDGSKVSLITRPRRFGKTLLMSTVEHFFDPRFKDYDQRFSNLKVWKSEKARELYGSIPVVFINFCAVKSNSYEKALNGIRIDLYNCLKKHDYLETSSKLSEKERYRFSSIIDELFNSKDDTGMEKLLISSMPLLCELLYKHHNQLPIILLDEYDTPLTEAYVYGYLDEMLSFSKELFNRLFKQNDYFYKAIITGVAKVAKNSLFSDMNNIQVCSCTSDKYSDCFGFTEQEVMDTLKCQNTGDMIKIKEMYDGFIFGSCKDIYNPWSIVNYMDEGILKAYWTGTAGNEIVGQLIRKHSVELKNDIEELIQGKSIHKRINEEVAIQYLDGDDDSFWALMLTTGYIKADNVVMDNDITECDISITNKETMGMFKNQIVRMIDEGEQLYNEFTRALLKHDEEELSIILNDISYMSASYFDTGKRPSERTPENFYHGLVLGLIVILKDSYRIVSNRESGRGRYDIAMYPLNKDADAFIMEFKVRDIKCEQNLDETAKRALLQIKEKNYEADLINSGISRDRIYKVGFGFEGKEVVVRIS